MPRFEICFAVTFCFAVALVGHRTKELVLKTRLDGHITICEKNVLSLIPGLNTDLFESVQLIFRLFRIFKFDFSVLTS